MHKPLGLYLKIVRDSQTLKNNNIDVYSVKTYAFTIKQSDVEKAKEVISFYDDIGGWRVSKSDNIALPTDNYKIIENTISSR